MKKVSGPLFRIGLVTALDSLQLALPHFSPLAVPRNHRWWRPRWRKLHLPHAPR